MKNLTEVKFFLDEIGKNIDSFQDVLDDDWEDFYDRLLDLLGMVQHESKDDKIIRIGNELYQLGQRTKAKKIFQKIKGEAIRKSKRFLDEGDEHKGHAPPKIQTIKGFKPEGGAFPADGGFERFENIQINNHG